jgi:hypothetical protein
MTDKAKKASGKGKGAQAARPRIDTSAMTEEQRAALALGDTIQVKEKPPKPRKAKEAPVSQPEDEAPQASKIGRPSTYTKEVADEICERLTEGEPLRQICRDERMPAWRTVYNWIAADDALAARIARARELGEDAIAQECLHIADTPMIGEETEESDDGFKVKRGDMLGHRKLQIETRLKLLAKWNPRKWGDKIDMNHGGQEGNPVNVATKVVVVPQKQKAIVETKPLDKRED